ncbi:MAG: hypothetical protein JMDDDDMK_00177 [Acidobacteria bacterium]|nr:hypothetical protein [Acidobacteriota bacterium]
MRGLPLRLLFGVARAFEIERVLHCERDLIGDEDEQFMIGFGKGLFPKTRQAEHTELAAMRNQRYAAARTDTRIIKAPIELGVQVRLFKTIAKHGLAGQ